MVEISFTARFSSARDVLFLPFWKDPKGVPEWASVQEKGWDEIVSPVLSLRDFQGNNKEVIWLYPQKIPRMALYGLGTRSQFSLEALRQSFSEVIRQAKQKKLKALSVVVPTISDLKGFAVEEVIAAIVESIELSHYQWSKAKDAPFVIEKIECIGIAPKYEAYIEKPQCIARATCFARDLINEGADTVTPSFLAEAAKTLGDTSAVSVNVFDIKQLQKKHFGLLLAVGKGGKEPPVLIKMSYQGKPHAADHTVLVGKGVTFDTGGLNLKTTGSMETMRCDMGGAAVVMGVMAAISKLCIPVNLTVLIPAAENAIDALSYKPGDVYVGYDGTTVEIGNTDAEGRLILADAIAYAVKELRPTRIIDIATLTGAVVIALGEEIAGLLANQDALAAQLLQASEQTGELLWRLPLYEGYRSLLESKIADLSNIGGGRSAGVIKGGLFLQHFVKDIPWAHIDIGGTAFSSKPHGYWPQHGVGFGVRLLTYFLIQLSNK